MVPSQPTFQDHIKELRHRVLWVILAIGLSGAIAYVLRVRLTTILQHPLGAPLYYTSPAGSFNFVLKLSLIIGVFIALPVMLYQILRFIEPALPMRIKRGLMVKVIGSSFLLAVAGVCFGFFLMIPMSLHFFLGYSTAQIKPIITADEYLSFVLNHLLTFAVAFQIPMIFLFINRIKPLQPSMLLKYQRHVIVGAFGLAILLPFTYDPLSQFIVAIPIVVLYYFSIVLLWIANRGKKYKPAPAVTPELSYKPQPVPVRQPLINTTPMLVPAFRPVRPTAMDGFVRPASTNTVLRPVAIKPQIIAVAPATSPTAQKVVPLRPLHRPKLSIDGILPPLATSI